MPTTSLGDHYVALSAMLTPALFMTANGSLIISTSNRMSRIVDRIRVLIEQADRLGRDPTELDYPDLRRDQLAAQLAHLEWRSERVRAALTQLYAALSAFLLTSLVLAADVVLDNRLRALPTGSAVAGVVLLLVASANLTREARRALGSNRQELTFHRALQDRRDADRR